MAGTGSFGVVFQASVQDSHETVAIKRVVHDRKYKVWLNAYIIHLCIICFFFV